MLKSIPSRISLVLALLTGVLVGYGNTSCSSEWSETTGKITCKDVTIDDYLSVMFEVKAAFITLIPQGHVARISISLLNSFIPELSEWLFLPWDDHLFVVHCIKVVNSSLTKVKFQPKLGFVETLDLSRNNISDYKFLSKMKKLKYLHLSNNIFSPDSYIFRFLQKEHTRLNLVNLSNCNLEKFGIITNLIDNYDFSFNPNLKVIHFNHTVGYRTPFLNLNGNRNNIVVKHLRLSNSFCVSINMSNTNNSLTNDFFKTVRISEKLLLSNDNIPYLNESIFKIVELMSVKCTGRISIDLSESSINSIASSFFSSSVLDSLNLSKNNLSSLEGSIFRKADILNLNMSSCNLTSISPSVFNYLTVNTLDLSRNNFTSLNNIFDYIESIKHLDVSFNPVEIIDRDTFKNCRDLETLILANTFIKNFGENSFFNLASLRSLTLSFKYPINSTLIRNMYVIELIIANTTLPRLNPEQFAGFYKLKRLTFLESSFSSADNLAFKGLSNLRKINNFREAMKYDLRVFQKLCSLEQLDLSHHDIASLSLELKELYSLKKLNLSSNAIATIDVNSFDTNKQLEVLSLSHNKLSSLEVGTFQKLNKLTHLYLNNNQFQQLPPGIFSGLDELYLLDVSHNDLLRTKPHLIFGVSMPNLSHLYLQGNAVGSEYAQGDNILRRNEFTTIATHKGLKYIDINSNGWRCATLIDILSIFKINNISYGPTNPDLKTTNINGVSCT